MLMNRTIINVSLGVAAILLSAAVAAQAATSGGLIIPLYPEGDCLSRRAGDPGAARQDGGTMIRNVSVPTLELFRPARGRANGTAMVVAPGGGFVGLGYDAGGTAVARKLAQHGITALVLKYRTIRSASDPMQMPEVHMQEMEIIMTRAKSGAPAEIPHFAGEQHAVDDGTRAMRMVRQRAAEWGIDPKRIGFIGFSAGAFLAVDLAQ
jgi:acetyl esterase/lipase